MTIMETWKVIPGFNGSFEASSTGHIRSSKTGRQITESEINSGYLIAYLPKHGNYFVHRLICSAFHDNPEGLNQVNHINGITTDNRAENLEWISLADNVRDFWSNPIFYEKQQKRREQISECMSTRIWVTDGVNNHRIHPEELENYPNFRRGRSIRRSPYICMRCCEPIADTPITIDDRYVFCPGCAQQLYQNIYGMKIPQ